jgi:hypothetical protein
LVKRAANLFDGSPTGTLPVANFPKLEAFLAHAQTGRTYLKLPMPEPHVVQQFSDALARLLAGFGK